MLQELLKDKEIILASGSPRRQQFFKELQIPVTIQVRPVEEIFPSTLRDEAITDYLSQLKAKAFEGELQPHQILITSDTIVCHLGKALGKPKDKEEAKAMLGSLSGHAHQVITSVCFTTAESQKTVNAVTRVNFLELTQGEIDFYVEHFKPYDKAGGYAIQEWIGQIGIESIEGSYYNVVGLPTHLVYQTLQDLGRP